MAFETGSKGGLRSLRPDVLKKKELNKEESALLNELKLESK